MAARVGFKSAGHFTKIVQGKANISIGLALRFADFLKFNKRETSYFQALVLFNQAKNYAEKKRHFETLRPFKNTRIVAIGEPQYELFEKWYYTVVREILAYFPVRDNFGELAVMIDPPISVKEAKNSIEVLEKHGLILKDANGFYRQADPLLKGYLQTQSFAIDNYILGGLDLARKAIDHFPRDERKLSATTVTISQTTYRKIVEELREFREHILTLARQDSAPERSYQINMQVFPVSKPCKKRNS
jgi:uncharacterized protein (TIGR02147 family)